jgi:hypothetical protein
MNRATSLPTLAGLLPRWFEPPAGGAPAVHDRLEWKAEMADYYRVVNSRR